MQFLSSSQNLTRTFFAARLRHFPALAHTSKVIREAGFDDMFYYFGYKRDSRLESSSSSKVGFFSSGEMTDSLRV